MGGGKFFQGEDKARGNRSGGGGWERKSRQDTMYLMSSIK